MGEAFAHNEQKNTPDSVKYNVSQNNTVVKNGGLDKKLRLHDLDEIIADRDRPVIKQSGIHRISAIDDNISQPSDVVNKDFSLRYDEAEFNAGRELSQSRRRRVYHQCVALYITNTKCCISSSRRRMHADA